MKRIFLLIVLSLAAMTATGQEKVKLYIAGDSTAQTYDPEQTLMRGWGQEIQQFFDADKLEVDNRAIGGRSTGSFIREERWKGIVDDLKADDWVLIQFGHNDTSTNPQRHVEPDEYKDNLMNMCSDVMAKGAHPIILTSIVMRTHRDGVLVDERPHFAEYIQLARDAASEICVPMIDMNQLTTNLVLELGDEKSKELYYHVKVGDHPKLQADKKDDTHLREAGAVTYAKMLAEAIKGAYLPLADYLNF
ncbi:MAG: rhamnogalacturonan acetylesterase [Tidjanibacter sp.]|nr:rhamnogalacturonan acetylesterase [Tidjanibacter sp.]